MNFKEVYSDALENAKQDIKSMDFNTAYFLGLSKSREHFQGSHTVVTYPPLDSLHKISDLNFVDNLIFPNEINSYLHIPVCDYRCTFCHYLTLHTSQTPKTSLDNLSYLDALKWEMKQWAAILNRQNSRVCSLYIGGGTPTALPINTLRNIIEYIHHVLPFTGLPQICVETSPKSLVSQNNKELLNMLEGNQVNRISIGIQSFHPTALKVAGRYSKLNKQQPIEEEALKILMESKIQNINIDMIQDLPLPSGTSHFEVLKHDLKKIMELKPPHITWYNMRLCPESFLTYSHTDDNGRSYYRLNNAKKEYCTPLQKDSFLMRLLIWRFMESIGYTVLEGDRFALKSEYEDNFRKARGSVTTGLLGMGVSSYSHIQNTFFRNITNSVSTGSTGAHTLKNFLDAIHNYINRVKNEHLPIDTFQYISIDEMVAGLFALGLKQGIDLEKIKTEYGSIEGCKDYLSYAESLISLMIAGDLVDNTGNFISLTTNGRLFENEICQKFYSPKISYLSYKNRGISPPSEIHNNYLHYAAV